jgi:hypothetical protein
VCFTREAGKLLLKSTAKEANTLCGVARDCLSKLATAADTATSTNGGSGGGGAWRLSVACALMSREDQAARFSLRSGRSID